MTTVVTTHDPVLLSIADRVVEIADGHLLPAS
jgi:putative ABC transport system ATP-binding protein